MNIHLKTSLNNIRRSPFQALAAVFVLFVTFFVSSILIVFIYSSNQLIKHYETRPQMIVFLKDTASEEDVGSLKTKLESDGRLKKVAHITKEQALEIYKNATKDNPLLSELVNPSVFPSSLEFSLNDLSYAEQVISELKNEEIVDEVRYTASLGGEESLTDVVSKLRQISYYIRLTGGIFIGFLLGTSLVLMIVIISMKMSTRRNEIFLEAIFYTLAGVFSGWFLCFVLVLYLTPSLMEYFQEIPILPQDALGLVILFGLIFAAELFVGLLLSFFGSVLAVARTRKRK